jgi:tetratricopeptide (TPR) repeat protein
VGDFNRAIKIGKRLKRLDQEAKNERDEFVFRSHVGLRQYDEVLSGVEDGEGTSLGLRAIRLMAVFFSDQDMREAVLMTLNEWLSDDSYGQNNQMVRLVLFTLYLHEDRTRDALQLFQTGTTMEQCALLVQTYLRMDRPDLAKAQLDQMRSADEDHTLSQLCLAWVGLSEGASKCRESAFIFDELVDKFGASSILLNGLAAAQIVMEQFEDAERALRDALKRDPTNVDSLTNLLVVYQFRGKSQEEIDEVIGKILSSPDTNHPTVQAMRQFEDGFNRICRRYSPDGPGEEEEQEGGESKEEEGGEEEEDSDLDLDDEGW